MNDETKDGGSPYERALRCYLMAGGEEALTRAYELGRQALSDGVGLLEMANRHHDALSTVLAPDASAQAVERIRAAGAFFLESLSPFEMSQRSVGEANAILRRLNHLLEEEAKRIAHALHDEAGGILASARVQLDLAVRNLPSEALARLLQVRKLLDDTGERLRHLSHELRPTILDDLGLGPALDFLAQGVRQRSGARIHVSAELRERLSPAIEFAVYRVAQEALNNAVRHAKGVSSIAVHLRREGVTLYCTISDDGEGFDVGEVLHKQGPKGLGVLGMRERVMAVGGTLSMESGPFQGTTVKILIPLEK